LASEEALLARIRELEAQLTASERTREVLIRRVESQPIQRPAEAFSIQLAMAGLEDTVRASTQQLARSEAHFRALYEHGPDMMFTVDGAGCILDRNQRAAGLGEIDLLSTLFNQPEAIEGLAASGFTGAGEREFELVSGDRVLLAVAPLPDREDAYHVVLRDITGFRALEQELQHTRRLASMGRLAAGIAKEINNPLAVILVGLELLESMGYEEPAMVAKQLRTVGDHVQRIEQFVGFLDVLARQGAGPTEEVSLNDLLDEALSKSKRRLGRAQLRRKVEPVDLQIIANPNHLRMAFVALFNACGDAMRRQGRLELRGWFEEGEVVLELRGPGMTQVANDLRQVDDWDVGDAGINRVSLGLAATIIAEHGGWLGSIGTNSPAPFLRIFLPGIPPKGQEIRGEGLNVLIVEDEEPMAELLCELLRTAGHRGRAVFTAEDALPVLDANEFDVVLCDLALPGMSGMMLSEAIANRWPSLDGRVILMSGFAQPPYRGARFLHKPFTRDQLIAALDDASSGLGAGSGTQQTVPPPR